MTLEVTVAMLHKHGEHAAADIVNGVRKRQEARQEANT